MNGQHYINDLARCTGCQACSIACKDRANLPDEFDWLRVESEEAGSYPTPSLIYRVMHCFHCVKPPCAEVCPTLAIRKLENGFVQIDAGTCNGCGLCLKACPFTAIVMLPTDVASKCDGCADEVDKGLEPTCVRACLMRALSYGPAKRVDLANRVKDTGFNEHGIGPSVTYLCWSGS